MRAPTKCEGCGEEIVFDLEGVNVFNPGDLTSLDPYIKPLFNEFGRERVLRTLDEIEERRGYKKVRFFEKCSKCGLEATFVLYTEPM
jgi:hypothetical protein